MSCEEEKQVLFATSIATELAKNLNEQEICDLIALVNQISHSLGTLYQIKKQHKRL